MIRQILAPWPHLDTTPNDLLCITGTLGLHEE